MDILSHALWADIGRRAVFENPTARRRHLLGWVFAGALLPDFVHAIPVVIWAVLGATDNVLNAVIAYALASPGTEPVMPAWVVVTSETLHCSFHSAVLAALVSLLIWRGDIKWRYLLLGWWSHILIDTFTHSTNFYPMRTFYPVSEWSFDGVAWNSSTFIVANYVLLGLVYAGIFLAGRHPWISMWTREKDSA